MNRTRYLTAKEAAQALDVSRATLYAYVSRGLVRSEAVGDDKRARRYYAEDVTRLQQQKTLRSNPRQAAQALHWGAPLIESQISLITEGKLYYRGLDVAELAQKRSIEEVASLIWLDEKGKSDSLFGQDKSFTAHFQEELSQLPPMTRFQASLPLFAREDWAAYELSREMVAQTGARILQTMAALAVNGQFSAQGIVDTLQKGWQSEQSNAHDLLNAALILSADHEFNVSAFTARCVASAGSTPYEVVQAGLAALQGVKHGGQTKKVSAFLRTVHDLGIRPTIREYLARGEPIPGFGHKLYAMGDPRATILLQMLRTNTPNAPLFALGQQIITELYNITGKHPNIDFALVMLAHVLNLPPTAPLTLFALGRTIGWIGHAIEQYESKQLIRPRARYTGRVPSSGLEG